MRYFLVFLFLSTYFATAQIDRIEPPFWWADMEQDSLQVMLYGKNIAQFEIKAKGANLIDIKRVKNENYLFLNFNLSSQSSGIFEIQFLKGNRIKHRVPYEIKSRRERSAIKSFDASDVIYLLMPDRFANGDLENDISKEVKEGVNRLNPDGRHGGDISGIINHLDYLEELGVTSIWSTPLCEDNDPKVSYHTYAQSDIYKIDPRFGTNHEYQKLGQELHRRGMKLIMDYVTNHWGIEHWMINDLPEENWIHQFETYTNTNHRKEIHSDAYASKIDKKELVQGWFVPTMADLNQSHPLLLRYLIQNAIWWIEYAGVDGFRVDTFPYNNPKPTVSWVKAIRNEYPEFNIVGEGWMHNSIHLSYWQEKSPIAAIQGFDSHLPSVMDFTLNDALVKAFNERNSYWEGGMTRIYKNLQNDFLYPNINNLLIFAENHDTNRINDLYPEFKSYQRLLTVLMTLRGIPQIYYGSEIGMTGNKSKGDGDIRRDFHGGWPEDSHNAFLSSGRTEKETLYFDFTKKLLNWRKKTVAVHFGKTLHYVPQEDVYVYFRYLREHRVMVVVNNNSKDQTLDMNRFEEGISGQTLAYEVLSDHHFTLGNSLEIPAETALIIELNEQ